MDLPAMAAQVSGAGLVFFCNPNNPTGTVCGADVVNDFIRTVTRTSPETIILMDEAYHEYVPDPSYQTAIPVALENPWVIVSRTFSKVYGMAGLRLGYAVGRKETLDKLRRYRLGNNVNALAAAAGVATLPDRERVAREVKLNAEAREFTTKAFADLGYPSAPSQANFVMVNIRRDVKAFQDACREHNVLIGRAFPPLTTYARVSIGTMDEMRQAVEVFKKALG
jgi:histidinol-phosphate aminotransferase